MNTTPLSKHDWVKHGMDRLADAGPDALKADLLAKSIGVSRGSFYWHFKNITEYRSALLHHWRATTTAATIAKLEQNIPRANRFATLLTRALVDSSSIERAVRAWALRDASVAAVVREVDEARIDYLKSTLVDAGLSKKKSAARAKLSYWAYIGRLMLLDPRHQKLTANDVTELATLISDNPQASSRSRKSSPTG